MTDRHTVIKPRCPLCGGRIVDTAEEPDNLRFHFVSGWCDDCETRLEIEYAAVDVHYYTDDGDRRSGVSDSLVPLSTMQYLTRDEQDGELPTAALDRYADLFGDRHPADDREASD